LAAKELEKAAVRVSPETCKTKMQNLKAQYKVQRLKNEKSGAGKMNWPYFDDMDIFIGNNPKVAPVFFGQELPYNKGRPANKGKTSLWQIHRKDQNNQTRINQNKKL
jgi:hypothetical protein